MNGIVGTNAENCSVPEARGRTDRGKTRTGRVVQCEVADTRVFEQMAVSPDTAWRATDDYEVAATISPGTIEETADVAERDAFRMKPCAYKATHGTYALVKNAFMVMEENQKKYEDDVVSYCVAVVQEIDRSISKRQLNDPASNDYKFMMFQLGPFYVKNLHPALEFIKSKADEGCGWEYYTEIILIGKYLELQAEELSANRNLVRSIYKQILGGEMLFLNHIKDHPVDYAVRSSDYCCNSLLKAGGAKKFTFLYPEEISGITKEKQQLMEIIEANLNKDGAGINIDKLRKDVRCGTAPKLDRRLYFYVLQDQCFKLINLYFPGNGKNRSPEEYLSCSRELLKLHVECTSFLSEFHSLSRSIKTELTDITELMMKTACDDSVRLEEEMIKLVMDMMVDKIVDPGCVTLYLYCKELDFPPGSAMRLVVQDDKITGDQCLKQLFTIESLIPGCGNTIASKANWLQAADILKQLLYNHFHEIKMLPDAEQHLRKINKLRAKLKNKLFFPVLQPYYRIMSASRKASNQGDIKAKWIGWASIMNHHHHTLVQLVPYKFVIAKARRLEDLAKAASLAWFYAVSELADRATSFREEDVDSLLALKHLAPLPDQFLRSSLEKALSKLFQIAMPPDGVDGIPDEKIEILSQWIHDLSLMGIVTEQLKKKHELWKKSHGYVANGKDMTSSKPDTPLTSAQESNNFQEIPGPVVSRKKTGGRTVSVTTGQVILNEGAQTGRAGQHNAAAIPEFHPMAAALTMPGISPPETNVGFPESQVDLKKYETLDPHFCEKLERLARDIANLPTGRALPATSRLKDVDQILFNTGWNVPPVTVMAPVDVMAANGKMETQKLDMNMASRSVPEAQGGAAQWAQTGRAGQRDEAAVPEFHPMAAVASDTFQQTGSDNKMAVQDTFETTGAAVSAEESGVIEIERCPYKTSDQIRQAIEISLRTLAKTQQMSGMDHLTFCLATIREFERVRNACRIDDSQSQDHKVLVFQFGPYYASRLRLALEILKDKADAQCIWEYYKDFTNIAGHFFLQSDEWIDKSANRELLKQIYQLAINNELNYLNFVKDFSLIEIISHAHHVLLWLFEHLKHDDLDLFSPETMKQLKCKMEKSVSEVYTSMTRAVVDQSDHNNDAIDRYIAKVERDLRSETADVLTGRLYSDLLKLKLAKLTNRYNTEEKGRKDIQGKFLVLKQLCEIHNKCVTFIPVSNFMYNAVVAAISGVTKLILRISLDYCVQLEKQILDLISALMRRRLLNKECVRLYLYCKELHVSMRDAVQPGKMTQRQYTQEINKIGSLIGAKTDVSFLAAAKRLKQLLFFQGIKVSANLHVSKLRKDLKDAWFFPVKEEIDSHKKIIEDDSVLDEYDVLLSQLRPKIVTLAPYVFVIDCLKFKMDFFHSICPVWRFDLERIAETKSLTEKDIDRLLELKHVAPDITNARIKNYLTRAFDNCLSLMVNECSGIPAEKIVMLAEWCSELDCLNNVSRHQQRIAPERNEPVPVPEETL